MSDVVLDSSAVLALLHAEAGADAVAAVLPGALISTVNLAEVVAKLMERGVPIDVVRASLEAIGLDIVDFDPGQAYASGELRPTTRAAGLSLGDRACLALARSRGLAAMSADSAWARVEDVEVRLIR